MLWFGRRSVPEAPKTDAKIFGSTPVIVSGSFLSTIAVIEIPSKFGPKNVSKEWDSIDSLISASRSILMICLGLKCLLVQTSVVVLKSLGRAND